MYWFLPNAWKLWKARDPFWSQRWRQRSADLKRLAVNDSLTPLRSNPLLNRPKRLGDEDVSDVDWRYGWVMPQRANQNATHTSEAQRGWVHPLMECSLQCKAGNPVFDGLQTKHCNYWVIVLNSCCILICLLGLQYLAHRVYYCNSISKWDHLIDWPSMLYDQLYIWHLKTIWSTATCLRSHAQYASGQTRKSPDMWPCPLVAVVEHELILPVIPNPGNSKILYIVFFQNGSANCPNLERPNSHVIHAYCPLKSLRSLLIWDALARECEGSKSYAAPKELRSRTQGHDLRLTLELPSVRILLTTASP